MLPLNYLSCSLHSHSLVRMLASPSLTSLTIDGSFGLPPHLPREDGKASETFATLFPSLRELRLICSSNFFDRPADATITHWMSAIPDTITLLQCNTPLVVPNVRSFPPSLTMLSLGPSVTEFVGEAFSSTMETLMAIKTRVPNLKSLILEVEEVGDASNTITSMDTGLFECLETLNLTKKVPGEWKIDPILKLTPRLTDLSIQSTFASPLGYSEDHPSFSSLYRLSLECCKIADARTFFENMPNLLFLQLIQCQIQPPRWHTFLPPMLNDLRAAGAIESLDLLPAGLQTLHISARHLDSRQNSWKKSTTKPLTPLLRGIPLPRGITELRVENFFLSLPDVSLLPPAITRLYCTTDSNWNQFELGELLAALPKAKRIEISNWIRLQQPHGGWSDDMSADFDLETCIARFFDKRVGSLRVKWIIEVEDFFSKSAQSLRFSWPIPGSSMYSPDLMREIAKLPHLEHVEDEFSSPLLNNFSWHETAPSRLITLHIGCLVPHLTFSDLPRSLTSLKTGKVPFQSSVYNPTSTTLEEAINKRFTSELPSGLVTLHLDSVCIKAENANTWPKNLSSLRFASRDWTDVKVAEMISQLPLLTEGAIIGSVEYTSRRETDLKFSKIFAYVRASCAPLEVFATTCARNFSQLLSTTLTDLSIADYEQDCDITKLALDAPAGSHFTKNRMKALFPGRHIDFYSEKERSTALKQVYRVDAKVPDDFGYLSSLQSLTTLKIARVALDSGMLRYLPQTLRFLFFISNASSAADLFSSVPKALETLHISSGKLITATKNELNLPPGSLVDFQSENIYVPVSDLEAVPTNWKSFCFNANWSWNEIDVQRLHRRMNQGGRTKLQVFRATIAGAFVPHSWVELSENQMLVLTNDILGEDCEIDWNALAAPMRLETATNLTSVNFERSLMTSLPSHFPAGFPSVLEKLTIQFANRKIAVEDMRALPNGLKELTIFFASSPLQGGTASALISLRDATSPTFWECLPRGLESLSVSNVPSILQLSSPADYPYDNRSATLNKDKNHSIMARTSCILHENPRAGGKEPAEPLFFDHTPLTSLKGLPTDRLWRLHLPCFFGTFSELSPYFGDLLRSEKGKFTIRPPPALHVGQLGVAVVPPVNVQYGAALPVPLAKQAAAAQPANAKFRAGAFVPAKLVATAPPAAAKHGNGFTATSTIGPAHKKMCR